MMRKTFIKICAVAVLLAGISGSVQAKKKEVSLLLVPHSEVPARIALDLANNYPVMVMTYKLNKKSAALQAWDGSKWVGISQEAYLNGTFAKVRPEMAIIVEAEGVPVPESLEPSEAWCPAAAKITTSSTRPLLHLLGRYYDFPYSYWKWFANRYDLKMDDINPEGLNVRWYHRRLDENVALRKQVNEDDMLHWVPLNEPITPVIEIPETEEAVPAAEGETETAPKIEEETVLSDDVSPAVVVGAGAVEEESAEVEKSTDESSEETADEEESESDEDTAE